MQGRIIKYRDDLAWGVILAEDGEKYRFSPREVQNPNGRLVGYEVDFVVDARAPKDIVLMWGTPFTAFGKPAAWKGTHQ